MPTWARANKDYECHDCGQIIHKGRTYVWRDNRADKRVEKSHPKCFVPKRSGRRKVING